jgi:lipid A 3-O-deacylase
MSRPLAIIAVVLILTAPPSAAAADVFPGPFSLFVENDTFSPGGDESYTQGMELQVTLERNPLPFMGRALDRLKRGHRFDPLHTGLLFGQTIFTPQNIVTYEPRQDDRPFVGHLYGGLSWDLTKRAWSFDDGRWLRPRRWTARVIAGVTGPQASGHSAQAGFHVLRESRIPKGWYTENGTRVQANAMLMREDGFKVFGLRDDRINGTLMERAVVGTVQDYVAIGTTLRVGKSLTAFPPTGIPERAGTTLTPRTEWGLFGGIEGRAYARNQLSDQGGEGRPSFVPLQWEWRAGGYARLKSGLGLSYTVIRRSQEIEPLPSGLVARHWVGALQISKSPGPPSSGVGRVGRWLAGTRVNLGLGRGRSEVVEGLPAAPDLSLASQWSLEYALFGDRFAVGAETIGLAREQGPNTADPGHKDTFLHANALTVGVELLPRKLRRHRLQLRVGGGKASAQIQTIPGEGGIAQPEIPDSIVDDGWSALAGVRYLFRTGKPLSLGTNFSYSRLDLDGEQTGVRDARFWSWTVGVQIHPWGRDRTDGSPSSDEDGLIDPTR